MRAACLALLVLVLTGCPKRGELQVAGSEDAELSDHEARLEELRAQAAGTSCPDRCDVASRLCDVAEELCEVVERHPDRADLPPRCTRARETCARAQTGCTRCRTP